MPTPKKASVALMRTAQAARTAVCAIAPCMELGSRCKNRIRHVGFPAATAVQGYVLTLALFSVLVFLVVDIIIAIIEPRSELT